MPDPSISLPATIHTMALAYTEICAGEDPWTALGNFTNAWYSHAKHIRSDLVREPLVKPEQETERLRRWSAFCAASTEFLCDRYGILCPEWVYDPHYILPSPWSGSDTFPELTQDRMGTAQPPFVKRNIFCGSRLFQNKYEMFEWTQEARAKGITDPREISRYARRKEIAIHGG
ncbi:MAG TPA: hypothetical protein VKR06_02640 [Ktedonosporobacter sp.]|nr:hypothetical protein [Ktedonosporobacter sp.]